VEEDAPRRWPLLGECEPADTFTGSLTKEAANGDRLDETLTGQFRATGSEGAFTVTGDTGRFRGANRDRQIFCTWTAVFTLKVINTRGDAIFSGDGSFADIGGTGRCKDAFGTFTTLFEPQPIPAGANQAFADYRQSVEIRRH
jgi:hypothetical protein